MGCVPDTDVQNGLWLAPAPDRPAPSPVVRQLTTLAGLASADEVLNRLLDVDWSFTDEQTGYLGHDLHPYPAKFIPQLPANLISALSLPGETVWDPFGGSGTTALEALLLGRQAISTDINPLASLVTAAKTTALTPEQHDVLDALQRRFDLLLQSSDLDRILERARIRIDDQIPEIPHLDKWFPSTAVRELGYIRGAIREVESPVSRVFATVALSSIVLSVSYQDGETRYARRIRDIAPGDTLRAFCNALKIALRKHSPMERLLGYRRAQVFTADARDLDDGSEGLPPESVDLIVTSPPYANANDYHLYHRFRIFWIGEDPRKMASAEIGSHLRHQRENRGFQLYVEDMRPALRSMQQRLRSGRYIALIVGDAVFKGKTFCAREAIRAIAKEEDLEFIGAVTRPLHASRRSFIPAARRARSEDIVILRKPPKRLQVHLKPPPYPMWDYEHTLRIQETKAVLGRKITGQGDISIRMSPYEADLVRRLTFTHEVVGAKGQPVWRTWQAILENGQAASARKDPKYVTHGLHPYKGKFYPQLCKSLLNLAQLQAGNMVIDPFCGSGTVLLEAQLNGYRSLGIEMNPVAALISRAKTCVVTQSAVLLDRVVKEFDGSIEHDMSTERDLDYFNTEFLPEILDWFPRPVAVKIGWIRRAIDRVPSLSAQDVLKVLLSSTIRQVSQQEPKDLRIRRRKQPLEDAPVLELFRRRIRGFRERLEHFAERMVWAPVEFREATVVEGDSRKGSTFDELTQPADGLITSPPYATALPYIDTDRLSLLTVLDVGRSDRNTLERTLTGSREIRERERRDLEELLEGDGIRDALLSPTAVKLIRRIHYLNSVNKVGFRRRNMTSLLTRYFSDMRAVLGQINEHVKARAPMYFIVGDNCTVAGANTVRITTARILEEMAHSIGWTTDKPIPITVTKDGHLHSKNSITDNVILRFRR